jgi:hypothetical protein
MIFKARSGEILNVMHLTINCSPENAPYGEVRVLLTFTDSTYGEERGRGAFVLSSAKTIREVLICAVDGGHWPLWFEAPFHSPLTGQLRATPTGPKGWWHTLHGVDPLDGWLCPLKIGVVDEALQVQGQRTPLAHVRNTGSEAWGNAGIPRAYQSLGSGHSFAVCSFLTARFDIESDSYAGFVPFADVTFCAAGCDEDESLDDERTINGIDLLVEKYQCDLISISAGDSDDPMPDLRSAVQEAARHGVLCFFAAGNEGGRPRFPACYPEVLAVGAVGREDAAPPQTWEANEAALATIRGQDSLFLCKLSASGQDVEFLGAGVCLFYTDLQGEHIGKVGTSFAAPLVVGVAARILGQDASYRNMPRDRSRSDYALTKLTQRGWNTLGPAASKFGILRV